MHGWRVIEPGQLQRIGKHRYGPPALVQLPEATTTGTDAWGA